MFRRYCLQSIWYYSWNLRDNPNILTSDALYWMQKKLVRTFSINISTVPYFDSDNFATHICHLAVHYLLSASPMACCISVHNNQLWQCSLSCVSFQSADVFTSVRQTRGSIQTHHNTSSYSIINIGLLVPANGCFPILPSPERLPRYSTLWHVKNLIYTYTVHGAIILTSRVFLSVFSAYVWIDIV